MRTLETGRLLLRPLNEGDEAFYRRIYMDPGIMRHVGETLAADDAMAAFARVCRLNAEPVFRYHCWVIVQRRTGEEVGLMGLRRCDGDAEIGGMILPEWQGKGVSGEAFPAGIEAAFVDHGVSCVTIRHRSDNRLAHGLSRKLGFVKDSQTEDGKWLQWFQTRKNWELGKCA
ncbi:GNAT family N-acetyltransferase [Pseudoxanthomonas wuyuanensis]